MEVGCTIPDPDSVRGKKIVPGITPCCGSGPQAIINGEHSLEIDADCVRDGDFLVCPNHPDKKVLFVFGTGWWPANGGSLWVDAMIRAWCHLCNQSITINTFSSRG